MKYFINLPLDEVQNSRAQWFSSRANVDLVPKFHVHCYQDNLQTSYIMQ
jgi:hypothetical protein